MIRRSFYLDLPSSTPTSLSHFGIDPPNLKYLPLGGFYHVNEKSDDSNSTQKNPVYTSSDLESALQTSETINPSSILGLLRCLPLITIWLLFRNPVHPQLSHPSPSPRLLLYHIIVHRSSDRSDHERQSCKSTLTSSVLGITYDSKHLIYFLDIQLSGFMSSEKVF